MKGKERVGKLKFTREHMTDMEKGQGRLTPKTPRASVVTREVRKEAHYTKRILE